MSCTIPQCSRRNKCSKSSRQLLAIGNLFERRSNDVANTAVCPGKLPGSVKLHRRKCMPNVCKIPVIEPALVYHELSLFRDVTILIGHNQMRSKLYSI